MGICASNIDSIEPKRNMKSGSGVGSSSNVSPNENINGAASDRNVPLTLRKEPFGEHYTLGHQLGVGFTSKVYTCTSIKSKAVFACKVMDKKKLQMKSNKSADSEKDASLIQRLRNEINVCASINHPHIVNIYDCFEDDKKVYLVMELMQGGELFDEIIERGSLSEAEAAKIIRKLVEALLYLHNQGICHRDMKPENILLKEAHDINDIKLIDFGMAKIFPRGITKTASTLGTPGYMAPEIMTRKSYTSAVDMWALGVVTYILLCGYMPFDETHGKSTRWKTDYPKEEWGRVSRAAKDFIDRLLEVEPGRRMTAVQCLSHRWFHMTLNPANKLESPRKLNKKKSGNFRSDDGVPQLTLPSDVSAKQK